MGKLLKPGQLAPDLRLPVFGGGEASLRVSAPVLLAFFKISCPVCQFTLPYLSRLHPGLEVWGVSQNDAEDTAEFAREFKIGYPILLDREEEFFPASNAFGITHVPTLFLLEPGGRIGRVIEGWNKKEMEALGAVGLADNVPAWKAG